MSAYRTSFTAGDGMLVITVDREQSGKPVARFSWDADETDGALRELTAALTAMGALQERRRQCRSAAPAGRRRTPRPRVIGAAVPMLDDLDQAIELLELGAKPGAEVGP
jgi:hypothetical protein